jgi:phenylacetate-CoA ligase
LKVGGDLSYYYRTLKDFYRLQRNLHLKKKDLVDHQNRLLRKIVKHAYDSVPLYRRKFDAAGVKPEQIRTIGDLQRLPCITKNDIKQNVNDAISTDYDMSMLRVLSTSGSTGQPLKIFISREEDGFRKAKHLRANYNCGHKPFHRWLTVTSPSHFSEVSGFQKSIKFYSPKFVSVFSDAKSQLAAIEKFDPVVLDGYSSSLTLLAREVNRTGGFNISPRIIFGGAELIDEFSRKAVEDAFKAPFYDQYATIEFERMAWQCPAKEGYHIDADSMILQFVDSNGDEVSAGESGQIVCTSLFNYAMPFIRYSVGDWGVYSDEPCSCGRTLPLLSKIEGRSDSLLFLPNGRALSPRAITITMGSFGMKDQIEQFRVVQKRKELLEIQLKTSDSPSTKAVINEGLMEAEIEKHFRSMLGIGDEEVSFEIRFVDEIPLGKNGKLQIIESAL